MLSANFSFTYLFSSYSDLHSCTPFHALVRDHRPSDSSSFERACFLGSLPPYLVRPCRNSRLYYLLSRNSIHWSRRTWDSCFLSFRPKGNFWCFYLCALRFLYVHQLVGLGLLVLWNHLGLVTMDLLDLGWLQVLPTLHVEHHAKQISQHLRSSGFLDLYCCVSGGCFTACSLCLANVVL